MEDPKPNLDLFDDPRFGEWRRGGSDNAWVGGWPIIGWLLDLFP
jgi:hypothetical protein